MRKSEASPVNRRRLKLSPTATGRDMADFNPAMFLKVTLDNLTALGRNMDAPGDGPALALVGNVFELGVEINNNLNRIAAAQERLAAIAEADFAGAVEHEVLARVEPAVAAVMKEKEKRSFIGQKRD